MAYFDINDGRRKSDPLFSVDGAPAHAPQWQLVRAVNAQDTVFTNRKLGTNCGHYRAIRFSVVPKDKNPLDPTSVEGGSANPDVEAMIWDDGSGSFLSFDSPITKTGIGGGDSYIVDVENANGAIILLAVTNNIAGQWVGIYCQGYEIDHSL